nr:hypothetical protein [Sinomonas gamaensis]
MERAYKILLAKADAQWAATGGESRQELKELAAQRAEWIAVAKHCYEVLWKTEDPAHVLLKGLEDKLEGISVAGVPMIGCIDRVEAAQGFGPTRSGLTTQ